MTTRKPLYGFLTAQGVSLVGTRVSMIALPWFVLTTTGSATRTGLVAFAEIAPMVVLKVLGGPVIDRLGARRVSIGSDWTSLVAVGAIPALYAADALTFPVFLLLVALAGALRGPGDGAKSALVPALVEQAAVPMERATGLSATVERTASMLGAAFAGGLVAVIGPADALVVDAVSFGLSAVVLAWATRPAQRTQPAQPVVGQPLPVVPALSQQEAPTPARYLTQLREGWDFMRRDRVLMGIAVMVALTNLLDMAWIGVLLPVWAKDSGGGAGAIGLLLAVFSGASVCGALMAAAWGPRLPRYTTYLVAFLIGGAPRFLVMVHGSPLWAVLAVAAVAGVTGGFINPILGAVKYERIPAPLIGRVASLTTAMAFALMPFGGLSFALVACGAAYFAVTMLPALDPRWREMDHRPAAQPADDLEPAAAAEPTAG